MVGAAGRARETEDERDEMIAARSRRGAQEFRESPTLQLELHRIQISGHVKGRNTSTHDACARQKKEKRA